MAEADYFRLIRLLMHNLAVIKRLQGVPPLGGQQAPPLQQELTDIHECLPGQLATAVDMTAALHGKILLRPVLQALVWETGKILAWAPASPPAAESLPCNEAHVACHDELLHQLPLLTGTHAAQGWPWLFCLTTSLRQRSSELCRVRVLLRTEVPAFRCAWHDAHSCWLLSAGKGGSAGLRKPELYVVTERAALADPLLCAAAPIMESVRALHGLAKRALRRRAIEREVRSLRLLAVWFAGASLLDQRGGTFVPHHLQACISAPIALPPLLWPRLTSLTLHPSLDYSQISHCSSWRARCTWLLCVLLVALVAGCTQLATGIALELPDNRWGLAATSSGTVLGLVCTLAMAVAAVKERTAERILQLRSKVEQSLQESMDAALQLEERLQSLGLLRFAARVAAIGDSLFDVDVQAQLELIGAQ